jgi:hypothetical protein
MSALRLTPAAFVLIVGLTALTAQAQFVPDPSDVLLRRLREARLEQSYEVEGCRLIALDRRSLAPAELARREVYEDFLTGQIPARALPRHLAAADRRVVRRFELARLDEYLRQGLITLDERREGELLLLFNPEDLDVENRTLCLRYRDLIAGRVDVNRLRGERRALERQRRERRLRALLDGQVISRAEYSEGMRLFRTPRNQLQGGEVQLLDLFAQLAGGALDAPGFRRQADRFGDIGLSDRQRRRRLDRLDDLEDRGILSKNELREARALIGRDPRAMDDRARALRRLYLQLGAPETPNLTAFRERLYFLDEGRDFPRRLRSQFALLERLFQQRRLRRGRFEEGRRLLLSSESRLVRKERRRRQVYEDLTSGRLAPERLEETITGEPSRVPVENVWDRRQEHANQLERLHRRRLIDRDQYRLGRQLLAANPNAQTELDRRRRGIFVDLCEGRCPAKELDDRLRLASRRPIPKPGSGRGDRGQRPENRPGQAGRPNRPAQEAPKPRKLTRTDQARIQKLQKLLQQKQISQAAFRASSELIRRPLSRLSRRDQQVLSFVNRVIEGRSPPHLLEPKLAEYGLIKAAPAPKPAPKPATKPKGRLGQGGGN